MTNQFVIDETLTERSQSHFVFIAGWFVCCDERWIIFSWQ